MSNSISAIYRIRNLVNGKIYIGSASNIRTRWAHHRYQLRNGRHENPHLLHAWRKYGEVAFVFETLERVSIAQLNECEQRWIDATPSEIRYNVGRWIDPQRGRKHTKESRRKTSEGLRRVHADPAWRARQSEICKQVHGTEEARRNHGEASRRNWQDSKIRARMIASMKKIWSLERKAQHAAVLSKWTSNPKWIAARTEKQLAFYKRRRLLRLEAANSLK